METELHRCAGDGDLERVTQLVEGGAHIEETDDDGMTALLVACVRGHFEIVVYLVERSANVTHSNSEGTTVLHWASLGNNVPTVKHLLEHGARITERGINGMTALLYAAGYGCLEVVQYLLSSEGCASISETDDAGNTALLLAAATIGFVGKPSVVTWLLAHGGAQITDRDNQGSSVWSGSDPDALPYALRGAYRRDDAGEYVATEGAARLTEMLRVMVLHGGPPESLTADLAPPLKRIVQDGARLRARLPAYLARRRSLLDAHCPLLPPLRALVHGYEEPTTTEELWATGLGAAP